MVDINIDSNNIRIGTIKEDELSQVWKWYRDVENYGYATGRDKPLSLDEVLNRFIEAKQSRWEFFLGIHENNYNKMLGVVKGRVRYLLRDEAWISSLLIDQAYQNEGIGQTVVAMLEDYFRDHLSIRWIYTGVLAANDSGILFWKGRDYENIRKTRYQLSVNKSPQDVLIMAKLVAGIEMNNVGKMVL